MEITQVFLRKKACRRGKLGENLATEEKGQRYEEHDGCGKTKGLYGVFRTQKPRRCMRAYFRRRKRCFFAQKQQHNGWGAIKIALHFDFIKYK